MPGAIAAGTAVYAKMEKFVDCIDFYERRDLEGPIQALRAGSRGVT
jgi:hypothetical protein